MKRFGLCFMSAMLMVLTVFIPGISQKTFAYSSSAECDSQYDPDWIFFQRSPQRQAQYNICVDAINGQWGDIPDMTGYQKCSNEVYKIVYSSSDPYDSPALLKSCMFGIYGEELSEDPGEKEVLEEIDDDVEDESLTRGPAWSEYNLETYCEGYEEDKRAGVLKDEYECSKDGDVYRVYKYNGKYYGEYLRPETIPQRCEDKFFLGSFVCKVAEFVTNTVDSIVNNLLLPMLQWRVLV